jgi:hypothetical protein
MMVTPAFGQDTDEIKTDRPDFVESSDVVGRGRLQIETSFAVEHDHVDGHRDRTRNTPTLLRIGAGESWELRIETDGRISSRTIDDQNGQANTTRGYADVSIGAKWHLQDQEGMRPGTAVLVHADTDTGSRAFRGNGIRPSIRVVAEWELAHDYSLGVMPGLIYDKAADGRRFTSGIFGIVVGRSWTDRFRTFIELAAPQIARAKHGGNIVTADLGAAYLLTTNTQLDVMFQKGVNKNAPDHAWTMGLSMKF